MEEVGPEEGREGEVGSDDENASELVTASEKSEIQQVPLYLT